MEKLTELQVSKINGINTDTKKMGLGNIIQDLITENKSLKTALTATKTVAPKQASKESTPSV